MDWREARLKAGCSHKAMLMIKAMAEENTQDKEAW